MTTTPDPTTVPTEETAVVDFALPLNVTKVATVFYAYDEQDESWEGAGFFAHLDTALWATARTYADEQYGYGEKPPAPMTWHKRHHLWHLHDGDDATDIVVSDSPLLGAGPDEQPQEFECEVRTKPIMAYPCILCEHEPDPWKKPDEQPQDTVPLTPAELAELTASIEHLSGPDAWDEDRLEPALIPVTHYVPRLLAMVTKGPLRPEFGVRIDYLSTLREERPVSDNLADAQAERDRIAERPDVVSCTVIEWLAGKWREIGDER